MDPNTAYVLGAAIAAIPATIAAWYARGASSKAHDARKEARHASSQATKAADNAQPVSNGFADGVRQQLSEILVIATEGRDAAIRAEGKVDRHIEAHANGHIAAPLGVVQGGRR